MTTKPRSRQNPRPLRILFQALPGILVWLCILGYLLGGLSWPGPLVLVTLAAGSLLAGALSVRGFAPFDWREFTRPWREAPARTLLLAGILLLALIGLASFLPPLVYAADHSLTVCRAESATYDRGSSPFIIHSVQYEDGPMLSLLDMKGDEPWNLIEDGLLAQASGACARFSGFFQGGLIVQLRQGPNVGNALIDWDGEEQVISLNASDEGVRRLELPGDHPASTTSLRWLLGTIFRVALVTTLAGAALGLALAFTSGKWGAGALKGDNVWLLLGLLALVGLMASGVLGRSSALMGDDFCYSGVALDGGVLNGTRQFYTGVNGRLLGNFVGLLSGYLFPFAQPPYVVFAILSLWAASLVPLLTRLLHWLTGRPSSTIAWALAATIVLVTLINAPDIYQSLFWRSGRQPLLFPLMLWPLVLALLMDLCGQKRGATIGWKWLALLLLAFCAGAFHEVYAAAQVVMVLGGIAVLVILQRSSSQRVPLLLQGLVSAFLGALLALSVHMLSPGTAERSSVLGSDFDPLRILYGALYDSNVFLFAANLNILTIGVTVFGVVLVVRSSQPSRFYKKHNLLAWLALPVIVYGAVLASFAVGHYGISQTMPERTQIIPTFIAILGAMLWGMLGGAEFLRQGHKVGKKTLQAVQIIALGVFGIAFVFHGYIMIGKQEAFDHYRRSVNVMISSIEAARLGGADHVVVSRLPDNLFGVVNPETDQRNFVNTCVDQLFGIEVGFN